jgi:hypothetical protein
MLEHSKIQRTFQIMMKNIEHIGVNDNFICELPWFKRKKLNIQNTSSAKSQYIFFM